MLSPSPFAKLHYVFVVFLVHIIVFCFYFPLQLITIVAITLNGANVVGYVKCRRDAGAKLTQMAGQFIGKQLLQQAVQQ